MTKSERETPTLCRFAGKTCGACCHGSRVRPDRLATRLRRQTALFRRHVGEQPTALALTLHEQRVRRGLDLLLAVVLHLPLVGRRVHAWHHGRTICAFLGRVSHDETVGCLIHPTLMRGVDWRERVAYRLVPGFGCGSPDFLCVGARRFQRADAQQRSALREATRDLDSFEYGRIAQTYAPTDAPEVAEEPARCQ